MTTASIHARKLRMGMIGGGPGGQIGVNHRQAARLDGEIELVAGAFSSSPEKSRDQGKRLYLDPERVYGDWQEMVEKESALPLDRRLDLISIVTPNHLHFAQARAALSAGFHVVLDKPMTLTLDEAKALYDIARNSDRVFALTHTYVGYPMVKVARTLVASGKLGAIRKVVVEYVSGYQEDRFR